MEQSLGTAKSSGAAIFGGTLRSVRRAGAAAAFLLLAACGTSAPPAQVSGRAGLIVGLSDGSFTTTCVTFEGSGFSGEDLLRQSGLPLDDRLRPDRDSNTIGQRRAGKVCR